MTVKLDRFDRSNPGDVGCLTFVNNRSELFELSQVTRVEEQTGENVLECIDRLSSITVNAPGGHVGADIQARMAKASLPDGVSVQYLRQLQQQ